jgi:putative zinc finger/helix-turn-helix YgiT family protein
MERKAEVLVEVRGEQIPVRTMALVCSRCGAQAFNEEQSKAYTIASADEYRSKHGLLTSAELRDIRGRLSLSQQAFAAFLKVGIASVKRWEAGLIQDEAMDELIRLKTDLAAARANVNRLEMRLKHAS